MNYTDGFDLPRRDSETGSHFLQERAVSGVVRVLQVDEANVQWDFVPLSQLNTAVGERRTNNSALIFRENPFVLAESTEPVGYDFEETFPADVTRMVPP